MRARSTFVIHVIWDAIEQEFLRGVACLILFSALLAASAPLAMVLTLPLLAYAGVWLAVGRSGDRLEHLSRPVTWMRRNGPFNSCRRLATELRVLSQETDDRDVVEQLRRIISLIDRSLDVLDEEARQHDAGCLNELTEMTSRLLNAYLRLIRRGFDVGESRLQLLEDLAAIEMALDDAWFRINRDAIVKLRTLSATVDLNIGSETV